MKKYYDPELEVISFEICDMTNYDENSVTYHGGNDFIIGDYSEEYDPVDEF